MGRAHGAFILVFAALMVGCEEQSVTTEPDATEQATRDAGQQTQETAQVGDSITLRGTDEGLQMEATVLEVVDPAKPSDEFFAPQEGNRFVAIRLGLRNVGALVYSDSPSNGAVFIDAEDQTFDASPFDEVNPALGSPKIAPADRRVGFITFEIPKTAQLRTFQLTLDSGFGPETTEWSL